MDNFNKIISFILGLVVVIVFFGVISGRIKLGKFTPSFAKKITPTPTPISSITIEENKTSDSYDYKRNQNVSQNTSNTSYYLSTRPKTIPSAGLPTFFIPSLVFGVFAGSYLKNKGK